MTDAEKIQKAIDELPDSGGIVNISEVLGGKKEITLTDPIRLAKNKSLK